MHVWSVYYADSETKRGHVWTSVNSSALAIGSALQPEASELGQNIHRPIPRRSLRLYLPCTSRLQLVPRSSTTRSHPCSFPTSTQPATHLYLCGCNEDCSRLPNGCDAFSKWVCCIEGVADKVAIITLPELTCGKRTCTGILRQSPSTAKSDCFIDQPHVREEGTCCFGVE